MLINSFSAACLLFFLSAVALLASKMWQITRAPQREGTMCCLKDVLLGGGFGLLRDFSHT